MTGRKTRILTRPTNFSGKNSFTALLQYKLAALEMCVLKHQSAGYVKSLGATFLWIPERVNVTHTHGLSDI
jgi:hypothetical protein